MSKAKVVLLSLLAAFAVSGATTDTASANNTHLFSIEQTPLTSGSETIVDQSQTTLVEVLISGSRFLTECQEGTSTGVLKPKGESTATIEFDHCFLFTKTAKGAKESLGDCEVAEPIRIAINDNLLEHSLDQLERFEGKIIVKGAKCVVAAEFIVEGTQACAIPESEFEKVIHRLTCTPAASAFSGALGTEKVPAQFFNEEKVKLSSGKLWGAN